MYPTLDVDFYHFGATVSCVLSIDDDLIVYGCHLLIPPCMRRQVLSNLHESHQGAVCTKQRARLTVYWAGMDNNIDNIVLSCKQCQDHLPSNPRESIVNKTKSPRPFHHPHGPRHNSHLTYPRYEAIRLSHCHSRHTLV